MIEPANDLERKLVLAADHPESRPDFYTALLNANVFVIGFSDSAYEGAQTLPAGAKLSIGNWQKPDGSPIIPFFSSLEALLETGMNHAAQPRVVQKDTQVLLGQPAHYPDKMVAALSAILARNSVVKATYLCLMHDPSVSERPSLVVGLEGEVDIARRQGRRGRSRRILRPLASRWTS